MDIGVQTHAPAMLSSVQVVIRATGGCSPLQVVQALHYNLLFCHLISAGEISCSVACLTINIVLEKLEKKFSTHMKKSGFFLTLFLKSISMLLIPTTLRRAETPHGSGV